MKRGLGVFVLLSFILILSLTFVSAGLFSDVIKNIGENIVKITGAATDVDLTPRVAFWAGKVNQHTENGVWMADPDGKSGTKIGEELAYCQKWYPNTISFQKYKMEKIITWRNAKNLGGPFTSIKQSYECVQESLPVCGDGICSSGEECSSCGEDCGPCVEQCTSNYDCPGGESCLGGVCVEISCTENDGGIEYNVKGDVTGKIGNSLKFFIDYCDNSVILNESYCDGANPKTISHDCGIENGICLNGACVPSCKDTCSSLGYNCETQTICRVSTNCGNCSIGNVCNSTGKCVATCTTEIDTAFCTRLNKTCGNFTANDNCNISRTVANCGTCSTGNICIEGACVEVINITPVCTDSDGGLNYYSKGEVVFYGTDGLKYTNYDYCSGTSIRYLTEVMYLTEHDCVNGESSSSVFKCPDGCENGACLTKEEVPKYTYTCDPLSTNIEGNNKLNILFIPGNATEEDLDYLKNNLLTKVSDFYNIEPFKSNRELLNFYFLRNTEPVYKNGVYLEEPFKAKWQKIANESCPYKITQYLMVIDYNMQVFSTLGEGIAVTTTSGDSFNIIHEFGHSFAGLVDTYFPFVRNDGVGDLERLDGPNVDEGGCSRWCQSNSGVYETSCTKITNEAECKMFNRISNQYGGDCGDLENCCVWLKDNAVDPFFKTKCVNLVGYKNIGIECLEGTGCYYGTFHQGKWRSIESFNTIMGGDAVNLIFDPVSIKALELKIKCCYPQTCNNFPSECKEYSKKYLAFADCGECISSEKGSGCSLDLDCGEREVCISGECVSVSSSGTILPIDLINESSCKSECPLNGKCYPLGYRKSGKYCSDNYEFVEERGNDESCENNFECTSNVCINNKCVDAGLWQKFLNWFKNIF